MHEHLVAYEYGSGQAWGFVMADSPETIARRLPEVDVYYVAPRWLTHEDLAVLRDHVTVDVADPHALDHILRGSVDGALALVS
ncbi:MAG TPA: hypothetical protein VGC47_05800 [Acidimicrobiia bacterium]|jgi:hypothetical protein